MQPHLSCCVLPGVWEQHPDKKLGQEGGLECWKAPVLPIWGLSRPWVKAHQNCRALEKIPALSRAWVWDKGFSEENKGSRLGSSEGHRGQGGAIKGRKWMKWP